ncbi:MAG: hypothetical protein RR444_11435, partial [Oscillospiraceae bacterium]
MNLYGKGFNGSADYYTEYDGLKLTNGYATLAQKQPPDYINIASKALAKDILKPNTLYTIVGTI